ELHDLVLLRNSPVDGSIDAYATAGGRLEVGPELDVSTLSDRLAVRPLAEIADRLPPTVRAALTGPDILCLPLPFQGLPLGLILGSVLPGRPLDTVFASAIASQTAVALANAGLFETVRRHELELRELSERQVQLREETLRDVSRELHDGLGQALAAIKVDVASIEQSSADDPTRLRERLRAVRVQVTELMQEVRRMSQLLRP